MPKQNFLVDGNEGICGVSGNRFELAEKSYLCMKCRRDKELYKHQDTVTRADGEPVLPWWWEEKIIFFLDRIW